MQDHHHHHHHHHHHDSIKRSESLFDKVNPFNDYAFNRRRWRKLFSKWMRIILLVVAVASLTYAAVIWTIPDPDPEEEANINVMTIE